MRSKNQPNRIRRSTGERILLSVNNMIIALFCLTVVYPFWYMIVLSFNEGADAMKGGVYFWPRVFTTFNYRMVLANPVVLNAYGITIARTLIGTVLGMVVTALAAYALACKTLPGRKLFNLIVLIPFVFSGGLIPYYLTLVELKIVNTFWVYILPMLFNIWNMFVMKQFFAEIPQSLTEAAIIDGAGDMTILWKIVCPISLPMFAAIGLFVAVGHWNSWFDGAYYVNSEKLIPLQTYLKKLLDSMQITMQNNTVGSNMSASVLSEEMSAITTNSVRMASIMVATAPIMLLYPFLQKYFVKGVRIGAVKG